MPAPTDSYRLGELLQWARAEILNHRHVIERLGIDLEVAGRINWDILNDADKAALTVCVLHAQLSILDREQSAHTGGRDRLFPSRN